VGAFTREGKSPFWYIVYQDRPGHQKQEVTDIPVDFKRRGPDGKPYVPKAVRELIRLREAGVLVRGRGRPRHGASAPELHPTPERVFVVSDLKRLVLAHYKRDGLRSASRVEDSYTHLERHFGARCDVRQVTTQAILRYVDARLGEGAARSTVYTQELWALRKGFLLAADIDEDIRIPKFPKKPKILNRRKGFVERGDFVRMRSFLSAPVAAFFTFVYVTGWRISEPISRTWVNVDWEMGTIRLDAEAHKGKTTKVFPFAEFPELLDVMKAQRARADELAKEGIEVPWVFFDERGRPFSSRSGPGGRIRREWRSALKLAKLDETLVPHDFRRSAIKNLNDAGVSEGRAMAMTGHATNWVFRGYDIGRENLETLRSTVRKYAAHMETVSDSRRGGSESRVKARETV
jgi:integrase